MKVLNLILKEKGGTRPFSFSVRRMVNAGYVGRDREAVRRHIEELKKEGVPAPEEVPTLYPVASYLITTGDELEVVDEATSGEAEFILLLADGKTYVAAGSDHTDRNLERSSIIKAKQICPNVLSSVVWPYEEVKEVWDELVLRSWVEKGGQRILYQKTKLASIMSAEDILSFVRSKLKDGDLEGMVIYSGTVPALGGEVIYGDGFEVELHNPQTDDSLWCKYKVKLLDYLD
ncbi:hypothetical protein ES703_19974 [subsurface metagenome]